MEHIALSKDSLHYRLATVYANASFYDMQDICSYARQVLYGALAALFAAAVGSFIAVCLVDSWIYLAFVLLTALPFSWAPHMTGVVGIALSIIAILVGVMYSCHWISNKKSKIKKTTRQPTFLTMAYRSWKEKYCIRVDWK